MKNLIFKLISCTLFISCISLIISPKTFAATIFSDDFTDTNGTSLTTHNNKWNILDGSAQIQNNTLYTQNGTHVNLPIPLTDQCASFNFQAPLVGRKELYLRAKDTPTQYTQNGYYFLIDHPENYQANFHMGDNSGWLNSEVPLGSLSSGWHNFKACAIGTQLTAYIDDALVADATARNNYAEGYARIGLSQGNSIDNFIYSDPNSSGLSLPVPLLKQGIFPYTDNNPAWEGQEFDHATRYGGFGCGTTIAQCGCAMTSLTMILQYHKVTKLPDGTELNPGTFNTWLKNNNGYYRDQGMNPYIAATVAKKAKSKNPEFTHDALEYERILGANKTQLTSDLQNGWPAVLEEHGHFIAATGIDNNTFTINDPAFNRTKLDSYGNTFLSLGRYIPSNTDLSYLVFAIDKEVNIALKDSAGNEVGETYINQPITDGTSENPTSTPEAKLKILAYAKPPTGSYTIEITSPVSKQYTLDEYTIDEKGDNKTESLKGIVSPNEKDLFNVSFDKQNSNNSNVNKKVTFDSTLEDIKNLNQQKLLHFSVTMSTTALIKNAEKLHVKRLDKPAEKLIDQARHIINKSPKRFVDPIAKEILLYDLNQLSKLVKN